MHKPTSRLRYLQLNMGQMKGQHPTALHIPGTPYATVLQQLWTSDFTNVNDEWRDIPVVAEGEV